MNQSEMKPTIFILFYFCRTLAQVVHEIEPVSSWNSKNGNLLQSEYSNSRKTV